jgi:hypothetical protein
MENRHVPPIPLDLILLWFEANSAKEQRAAAILAMPVSTVRRRMTVPSPNACEAARYVFHYI